MIRILIIDDNVSICEILNEALSEKGYKVDVCSSVETALNLINASRYDIIISDLKMDKLSGIDLLKYIKINYRDIEVIIITAFGDVETAVEAMRFGAYDFILKPFKIEEIEKKIENIAKQIKLSRNNEYLAEELAGMLDFTQIIGESPKILQTLNNIEKVAKTNTSVLLYGETGTGKELAARAIHNKSARKDNAFVKINCAALPDELIEAELFGHVKGAFTSAYKDRIGRFELADKGTLFIDEISELNLSAQLKLLRVIQEKEFERIGSSDTIKTDTRLIFATNKNLEELVKKKFFRSDLFYRINIFPIVIPPLRDRKEDIPALIQRFILKHSTQNNKKNIIIGNDVVELLREYEWPGNIRELENIIERMIVISGTDGKITINDAPYEIRKAAAGIALQNDKDFSYEKFGSLPEMVGAIEESIIRTYLLKNKNNSV